MCGSTLNKCSSDGSDRSNPTTEKLEGKSMTVGISESFMVPDFSPLVVLSSILENLGY